MDAVRRAALAFWLTGAALSGMARAGGGGAPPADVLSPLKALSGQKFDAAWLRETATAQGFLSGLAQVEQQYGQQMNLKAWAAADLKQRQAAQHRLQALNVQLSAGRNEWRYDLAASHTDFVLGDSSKRSKAFLAHADAFFLSEYPRESTQLVRLARLGLSRSQNPAVRQEAATILAFETSQQHESKRLK